MKMMSIVCAIGFWVMVIPLLMNKLQLNISDLDWGFGGSSRSIWFVFCIVCFYYCGIYVW